MKKLFILISMLFVFSLAYSGNIIVSPNGEILENCGNNHYAYPGNCPTYNDNNSGRMGADSDYIMHYYTFPYDKDSGAYGAGQNTYKDLSKNQALARCGTPNCKIIFSKKAMFTNLDVAASSNGVVVTETKGVYNDLEKKALLEKCAKKKGVDCKIIWSSQGKSKGW